VRPKALSALIILTGIFLVLTGCSGEKGYRSPFAPTGTTPATQPEGVEAPADAQGEDAGGAEGGGQAGSTTPAAAGDDEGAPPPAPVPKTEKVCQLTGEYDRQLRQKTLNMTGSRYDLYGTDLGVSFPVGDRLYFLFGDSWLGADETAFTIYNRDAIAYAPIADLSGSECIGLTFESEQASPDDPVKYRPITIQGGEVGYDGFEVPVGGFEAAGNMYIFFATDAEYHAVAPLPSQRITPTRTVLARRAPGEEDFTYLYDLSTYAHDPSYIYPYLPPAFINVSPVLVDSAETPGLPKPGKGLLLYGSGYYRLSKVYLAYVNLDDIEKALPIEGLEGRYRPSDIYFFAGLDTLGAPIWRSDWENHTSAAAPLFDIRGENGQPAQDIGELSVIFDAKSGKFYMAYQSINDRGVIFRYAGKSSPWAFSEGQKLFYPEMGYGVFIHSAFLDDGLNDPGRFGWGGEYGPYMIPQKFVLDSETGEETIYFVLSTWNPYEVVLMKSELKL
jgi:hypothetical protein